MLFEIIKRFWQIFLLLALQVLLMNHIHILGYGSPLVYVALLLYFPVNAHRVLTLLWAFTLGFLVDVFSNTPGLSAASMTFVAFLQPSWLRLLTPKDSAEDFMPSFRSMGIWNHLRYLTLLLMLHHVVYFLLESFSFYNLRDLGLAAGASFCLSWLSIVVLEMLRRGKKKHD